MLARRPTRADGGRQGWRRPRSPRVTGQGEPIRVGVRYRYQDGTAWTGRERRGSPAPRRWWRPTVRPAGRFHWRYWTGQWTEHVSRDQELFVDRSTTAQRELISRRVGPRPGAPAVAISLRPRSRRRPRAPRRRQRGQPGVEPQVCLDRVEITPKRAQSACAGADRSLTPAHGDRVTYGASTPGARRQLAEGQLAASDRNVGIVEREQRRHGACAVAERRCDVGGAATHPAAGSSPCSRSRHAQGSARASAWRGRPSAGIVVVGGGRRGGHRSTGSNGDRCRERRGRQQATAPASLMGASR